MSQSKFREPHLPRKRRIVVLAIALPLLVAATLPCISVWYFFGAFAVTRHEFILVDRPTFLTEALALDKARESLVLDGLDLKDWLPHPDGRTSAPDGRADRYLSRNAVDSNRGSILFVRSDQAVVRFVDVELLNDRIICEISRGK
jgi:hypothetical protein